MSTSSIISTPFISRLKLQPNHSFKKPNHVHVNKTLPRQAVHALYNFHPHSLKSFLSPSNGERLLVPYAGFRSSGNPAEEDGRALEAVLKLYSAIKQRNLREISNVIGDECRCVCNFIPTFHPFHGKKQVLELFVYLMRYMGQHVEFVVQPTLHDGMTVSVKWSLVWDKTHMPLGKGFSFYVCHTYQGKVVIKHMEMIMEPLLHIEPLRLKVIGIVMAILERIRSNHVIKNHGKRIKFLLLGVVIIVALLLQSKLFFC